MQNTLNKKRISFKNNQDIIERTAFDIWLFNRGISKSQAAKAINIRPIVLARYTLPPSHKNFVRASLSIRLKIQDLSEGVVTLNDWPEKPMREHDKPSPKLGQNLSQNNEVSA